MRRAALALLILAASPAVAEPPISVCSTPGRDYTGIIVRELAGARRTILVQVSILKTPSIKLPVQMP